MMRIHELLQDSRIANSSRLAAVLEVSTKTVQRDVAFMRDRLGLPIEYDEKIYAYRYAYPVKSFPTVQISEGELLALLVAERALREYEGTPYHSQLAHAFEKLTNSLHGKVSFSPDGMNKISFHHAGTGRTDLKVFERLSQALRESREVQFEYLKPGLAKPELRRVHPYHLANRESFWYLVAHDVDRADMRHFAVARIRQVSLTERHFIPSTGFDPERHFAKSFGAFVGDEDHHVVVRFASVIAHRVKERLWHQSQTETERPDGSVDVSLRVGNLDEVEQWVLGWGPNVKVLAPAALAARVREATRRVQKLYAR